MMPPYHNRDQLSPRSAHEKSHQGIQAKDAASDTMRGLTLVFLASLRLCRARQPGFSIHDDLLAHPQVRLSSKTTSPQRALSLTLAPAAV